MAIDNNLERVLNYIEDNTQKSITLYDIAKVSGYSVPQFYRLFKRLTGDTIGEYILRRKMSKAAIDLKSTSKTISEIAFEYGFESHDVFTRAFNRVYGINPRKYRESSVVIPPLKRLIIVNNDDNYNEKQMKFSIRNLESFNVIGMECEAYQWDSDGAIGNLWSEFLGRLEEITNVLSPRIILGICENETCNNNRFKYMAAVRVISIEQIPEGMITRRIRAQKFFQASVPQQIGVADSYTSAVNYAKSLGYVIENYDDFELYCKCQYIFVQKVENKNVQKSSFKLSLKYLLNTVA